MTRFDRHFDRSLGSLAREAAEGALGDASVTADAVEFVAFGNAAAGILTGQEMIRAQTALAGGGLEGAPMINVENACASASSAFHLAFNAIRSGQHEVALAVGAEKMNVADRNLANVALARAVNVGSLQLHSTHASTTNHASGNSSPGWGGTPGALSRRRVKSSGVDLAPRRSNNSAAVSTASTF